MHFSSLNRPVSLNSLGLSLCLRVKQRSHLRHIYHTLIFASCNISLIVSRSIISVKFNIAQVGQSVLTTKRGLFTKGSIEAGYSVSVGTERTDLRMDLKDARGGSVQYEAG